LLSERQQQQQQQLTAIIEKMGTVTAAQGSPSSSRPTAKPLSEAEQRQAVRAATASYYAK